MALGFWNVGKIPELRARIIFSAALLAVYRIGIFISLPGVDRIALSRAFGELQGTLFGMLNMFSGGAFEQASIFALGIMPYISASIVMQFATFLIPALERLQKEGEGGRRRINQLTRYGSILLALGQSIGVANYLLSAPSGTRVVENPGAAFYFMTMVTLTAGTAFVMWLGEQITERGIGNGMSLIIFAGIVAQLPETVATTVKYIREDMLPAASVVFLLAILVSVIAFILHCEQATRRIPIHYAKRAAAGGGEVSGSPAQMSHLPLKINTSGVLPPIFASSVLMLPATLANFLPGQTLSQFSQAFFSSQWLYNTLFVLLIIFFCYYYTAIMFNATDVADNLKKYGGYIPGVRPGKQTAEYIDHVIGRITFGGALYLSAICLMPVLVSGYFEVPFRFGGTALLIVVGVALDTVRQIEGYLITQNYDGFAGARGPRIRGRR